MNSRVGEVWRSRTHVELILVLLEESTFDGWSSYEVLILEDNGAPGRVGTVGRWSESPARPWDSSQTMERVL